MTNKSPLAAITDKINKAKRNGIDVINLAVGEPDFSVPDYIKKGTEEKIENGGKETDGYTETLGIRPLRQAIADKFNKELGKLGKWQPEDVIVTPGAKFALAAAIRAAVKSGSSAGKNKPAVLILNPAWPTFAAQVRLMDAVPVFADTMGKEIDLGMLEKATEGYELKAIIINSPSNPTGRILKSEELEVVAEFAEKHGIWIISDEIYRRISYIELPLPIAHFAPARTITIGGFSKEYAMTGWRLGYAIAPNGIISEMEAWQSQTVTCASAPIQHAGLIALTSPEGEKAVRQMVDEFARRRGLVAERLGEIPELIFNKPDGAFYFFINVKAYLNEEMKTAEDWVDYLFDGAQVAVAPGSVFGARDCIRLSFAASEKDLIEAMGRIKIAFERLKKK